ncbi:MAG: 50S ribosomal protein L10 [Candidatus Helarchaeota archaeon]|nr:50S ribosomal protein L10 [Candidatus Helarchaeota archaeon]
MSIADKKRIPQQKLETVKELTKLIESYPIIGLCKMEKIPSKQLQIIRKKLRNTAVIRMAKSRLIKFAFEKFGDKTGYKELMDKMKGSTALIFTNLNIFKLVKILNDNKAQAPAKSGDIAPDDIIIPEKDTGFPPGPVISELNSVGLQTKVQSGTIHIKEEKVIAKKGDEISLQLAIVLTKLNIFPMQVGLSLYTAFDNGALLKDDDLQVDFSEIIEQLKLAHASAFNISLEITFPNKENITQLLLKAHQQAKSVITSAPVFEKEFIKDILFKAYNNSNIILSKILENDPNALPIEMPTQTKDIEKEKEKEKEKPPEETSTGGLGNLFK